MTKGITIATAKAVAAGNSARQEDIIHTANLSRKAMSDMLSTCKVLSQLFCDYGGRPGSTPSLFCSPGSVCFSKPPTIQMLVRR